jgi:hypothetical protein
MHVCMYVRTYVSVYVCMYVSMYVYMYVCIKNAGFAIKTQLYYLTNQLHVSTTVL